MVALRVDTELPVAAALSGADPQVIQKARQRAAKDDFLEHSRTHQICEAAETAETPSPRDTASYHFRLAAGKVPVERV